MMEGPERENALGYCQIMTVRACLQVLARKRSFEGPTDTCIHANNAC